MSEDGKIIWKKQKLKKVLKEQIERGNTMMEKYAKVKREDEFESLDKAYERWNKYNKSVLKKAFENPHNNFWEEYKNSDHLIGTTEVAQKGVNPKSIGHRYKYFEKRLSEKIESLKSIRERIDLLEEADKTEVEVEDSELYVAPKRISELEKINESHELDLSFLIELCNELNDNYVRCNYLAVSMIIRTILYHIPPIFNQDYDFEKVVGQHGRGSVKKALKRLLQVAKESSNLNLHRRVSKNVTLPSPQQVEFRSDLDILLSEVIKQLKEDPE